MRWYPLQADPPEHFKYRSVLQPFFARGRVRGYEARIRSLAVRLLDEGGRPERTDLCRLLSLPLTGGVLCMFLGFPEGDWSRLKDWTAAQIAAAGAGDRDGAMAVMQAISADVTTYVVYVSPEYVT